MAHAGPLRRAGAAPAQWRAAAGIGRESGAHPNLSGFFRRRGMVFGMEDRPRDDGRLFDDDEIESHGVFISARARLQTCDGYRVVSACGVVLAHYAVGDRMGEAHAMVSLVEQGWAYQKEVARAFGCSERTVRRHQRRFESGGLGALGRSGGYPKGRPRLPACRLQIVEQWKAKGLGNREIARRLGVGENAVRKLLRRLGWKREEPEQLDMCFQAAHPNLSARRCPAGAGAPCEALEPPLEAREAPAGTAHPNLSAPSSRDEVQAVSFDSDPSAREVDRMLACMGLLSDAAPLFESRQAVPKAGVLLAIPALVESGILRLADEIYGSIGPAFYGLRTTVVTFLLMALLRIKRAEGLKEHSPRQLGRLLGLDRAPEVKTLRRKLARLAALGRATELGRALAGQRVRTRGHAMGFLYVDGHVRAYHGKRALPKTHVARIRLSMPATTDYWVNDAQGEPLFVVTTGANQGLVKMLPLVLEEARALVGSRRLTVVFDRGGWSPQLFARLLDDGFDILTYRKGHSPRLPERSFTSHHATLDGHPLHYRLADQGVHIEHGPCGRRRRLHLRQVTRLGQDGHQTPIITSRRDLPAIEVAHRMFERWRQENFFKYLREQYALDALVDYGVEPADPTRSVPNPERKALDAKLHKAYVELNKLAAQLGLAAINNPESLRRTMRGFKIANSPLHQLILAHMEAIAQLETRRAKVPARVPVGQLLEGEAIKLAVERKHLTDLFKMVAYQAESDLLGLLDPHYRRAQHEGRTFIHNALATAGDIELTASALHVALQPLSSPHRTKALAALCEQINQTRTRFPGSKLPLRFTVKPEPPESLAFPGPRSAPTEPKPPPPDISI